MNYDIMCKGTLDFDGFGCIYQFLSTLYSDIVMACVDGTHVKNPYDIDFFFFTTQPSCIYENHFLTQWYLLVHNIFIVFCFYFIQQFSVWDVLYWSHLHQIHFISSWRSMNMSASKGFWKNFRSPQKILFQNGKFHRNTSWLKLICGWKDWSRIWYCQENCWILRSCWTFSYKRVFEM